jgi:hypothetical protein
VRAYIEIVRAMCQVVMIVLLLAAFGSYGDKPATTRTVVVVAGLVATLCRPKERG